MKRRTLFSLCGLALLLAILSGCAPAAIPAPENKGLRAAPAEAVLLPTDGYPLTVGGAVLRPPVALATLEGLGFSVAPPEEPTLPPLTVGGSVTVTGRGTCFTGWLHNPGQEACSWRDCLLVSLRADGDVAADGGVTIGSTRDQVSAAYGEIDEGVVEKQSVWMMYGTWLYYGLGFEIDNASQRVVSIASFCVPLGEAEGERP